MIWALLAAFLFGGGTNSSASIITQAMIDQMIDQVEMVIVDPKRANAAVDNLDVMGDEIKNFNKKLAKSGKELGKLYTDHESNTMSMLSNLEALNTEWYATQQRILDQRFKLKNSISEDEWNKIFSDSEATEVLNKTQNDAP